jgi:hypothetical protein
MSSYNYSIASDTANAKVNSPKLTIEIDESSITIGLDRIDTDGDTLTIVFDSSLSAEEETTLDGLIGAHDGESIPVVESPQLVTLEEKKSPTTNRLEVQIMKPEGSSATIVTYDWCDKTTWYQKSTEVTGETMTDSGDGLTFNSVNEYWIDLTHGKLYDEYNLADKKEPKIYDNGTEVTSGITIDYTSGDVTFDSAPTGPITCDYWYAGDSTWTLVPTVGKSIFIEHAELNFSSDVLVNSPFNFEIWVYNPYDLPNKVLYQKVKYKNIRDIINAANLGQGYIPKIAGLQNDVLVFPFNYATVKPLQTSTGAELRVSIDNDEEITGEWATATFYVLSEDE